MIEAFEPVGRDGKSGAPFADPEPDEEDRREEQQELELRTRVTHRGQPAIACRGLLECQFGYALLYRIRDSCLHLADAG